MVMINQENEDMKQIISQYEERYLEIRKHIEQIN